MPEDVKLLKIVVASPTDVQAERDLVPVIADELNHGILRLFKLQVAVLKWETESFPGFHVSGPQALVDKALKIEDCDILVGIFWKRFGTPVKDAGSGTEHEFRLAYDSWKKNGRPQIMFYFNEKQYTLSSTEDADQCRKVLEFRRTFPGTGMFWPYKGRNEFGKLVRRHLTEFVLDIVKPIMIIEHTSTAIAVAQTIRVEGQ